MGRRIKGTRNSYVSSDIESVTLIFGTGEDGDIVLDGSPVTGFTLTRGSTYRLDTDLQATSLRIESGITLDADIRYMRVAGRLTNAGTILRQGTSASGSTGGSGGSYSKWFRTLGGAGGNGASYVTDTEDGDAGATFSADYTGNFHIAGYNYGGVGGAGGAGGAAAGGAAGAITGLMMLSAYIPPIDTFDLFFRRAAVGGYIVYGGEGGGGGGYSTLGADAGGHGGGGGGGAWLLPVLCIEYDGTGGTIRSEGGAGADGVSNSANEICGGGGGGGGGPVVLCCARLIEQGTVESVGGAGGTGANGGANGADGVPSTHVYVVTISG